MLNTGAQVNTRAVCPSCGTRGKKQNMSVDEEKGVYHCFKCQSAGKIAGSGVKMKYSMERLPVSRPEPGQREYKPLDSALVDQCIQDLPGSVAEVYLESRGISRAIMKKMNVGYLREHDQDWVMMFHFVDGVPWNYKKRSIDGEKQYQNGKNRRTVLYNSDCITKYRDIIICEGEIDALTLMSKGYQNVVATTCGAGTFNDEWISLLRGKSIVIIYDSDSAGRVGADNLAKKLACFVKNVRLPEQYEDINDFFKAGHTRKDLDDMIDATERHLTVNHVKTPLQAIEDEWEREELGGFPFPWSSMNDVFGENKPGDLVVIAAPQKTGKSIFIDNIINYLLNDNRRVLSFNLEERNTKRIRRLVQIQQNKGKYDVSRKDMEEYAKRHEDRLILGDSSMNMNWNMLIDSAVRTHMASPITLLAVDNLHILARGEDENRVMGEISKQLKSFANDMGVVVFLVHHPRKPLVDSNKPINFWELRGSGAITQDADKVIILHRDSHRDSAGLHQSDTMLVRLDIARDRQPGDVKLRFYGSKATIMERSGMEF